MTQPYTDWNINPDDVLILRHLLRRQREIAEDPIVIRGAVPQQVFRKDADAPGQAVEPLLSDHAADVVKFVAPVFVCKAGDHIGLCSMPPIHATGGIWRLSVEGHVVVFGEVGLQPVQRRRIRRGDGGDALAQLFTGVQIVTFQQLIGGFQEFLI